MVLMKTQHVIHHTIIMTKRINHIRLHRKTVATCIISSADFVFNISPLFDKPQYIILHLSY